MYQGGGIKTCKVESIGMIDSQSNLASKKALIDTENEACWCGLYIVTGCTVGPPAGIKEKHIFTPL